MPPSTPGYSGTPLFRKLGIDEGTVVVSKNAPTEYRTWLEPLPADVVFSNRLSRKTDIVHLFTTDRAELIRELRKLRTRIRPNAAVWVSWPKKASKVPTTVTEDTIRHTALPLGFVDIKVCAVSDIWSALKLVIRRELR
ncbi:MAG: DUF3052 family protein [Opitutaceae bacterium]|jgi:hypothetical protein|nr:DUF3052 family protein [Opitutaceae bacterium]